MRIFLKRFRPDEYAALLATEEAEAALRGDAAENDSDEESGSAEEDEASKAARMEKAAARAAKAAERAANKQKKLAAVEAAAQAEAAKFAAALAEEREGNQARSCPLDGEITCDVCGTLGSALTLPASVVAEEEAPQNSELDEAEPLALTDLDPHSIVSCSRCAVAVHLGCYGVTRVTSPDRWVCDRCAQLLPSVVRVTK